MALYASGLAFLHDAGALASDSPTKTILLFKCSILLFLILAVQPAKRATVIFGPIVNSGNGDTYYLLSPDTWTHSETAAVALGGHLATVHNHSENDWLLSTFGPLTFNSNNLWIGFYDPVLNDGTGSQHAADFVWVSGAPNTYTNWALGQPDNFATFGGEYFAILEVLQYSNILPGKWNDQSNTASGSANYGIVEVPAPEPSSFGLLSLGLIGFASRRKR